jgi:hypothetical protein
MKGIGASSGFFVDSQVVSGIGAGDHPWSTPVLIGRCTIDREAAVAFEPNPGAIAELLGQIGEAFVIMAIFIDPKGQSNGPKPHFGSPLCTGNRTATSL